MLNHESLVNIKDNSKFVLLSVGLHLRRHHFLPTSLLSQAADAGAAYPCKLPLTQRLKVFCIILLSILFSLASRRAPLGSVIMGSACVVLLSCPLLCPVSPVFPRCAGMQSLLESLRSAVFLFVNSDFYLYRVTAIVVNLIAHMAPSRTPWLRTKIALSTVRAIKPNHRHGLVHRRAPHLGIKCRSKSKPVPANCR